jgi:hypothetical protein
MGRFFCRTEKKIAAAPYFWRKKNIFKFTAKFKFSSVP